MAHLTWSEKTVAGELAGAIMSVAAYIKHRPEKADLLRAAVLACLGDDERDLLARLDEDA